MRILLSLACLVLVCSAKASDKWVKYLRRRLALKQQILWLEEPMVVGSQYPNVRLKSGESTKKTEKPVNKDKILSKWNQVMIPKYIRRCLDPATTDDQLSCICGSGDYYLQRCFHNQNIFPTMHTEGNKYENFKNNPFYCTVCGQIVLWTQGAKMPREKDTSQINDILGIAKAKDCIDTVNRNGQCVEEVIIEGKAKLGTSSLADMFGAEENPSVSRNLMKKAHRGNVESFFRRLIDNQQTTVTSETRPVPCLSMEIAQKCLNLDYRFPEQYINYPGSQREIKWSEVLKTANYTPTRARLTYKQLRNLYMPRAPKVEPQKRYTVYTSGNNVVMS